MKRYIKWHCFFCGNTKSGMSKLQKTTTPRSEGILDTVIQKVQALRLFTTE